ncbi:unnamed protein product [Paramecium sonneborni]|uniref:Uncharacterized protein n=1 Tax=Paramecium sonneborni TaxID=65129 RepID=A0A8S1L0S6_9CILI|nr:unnamed protein product [Paramecium sonneborni]
MESQSVILIKLNWWQQSTLKNSIQKKSKLITRVNKYQKVIYVSPQQKALHFSLEFKQEKYLHTIKTGVLFLQYYHNLNQMMNQLIVVIFSL